MNKQLYKRICCLQFSLTENCIESAKFMLDMLYVTLRTKQDLAEFQAVLGFKVQDQIRKIKRTTGLSRPVISSIDSLSRKVDSLNSIQSLIDKRERTIAQVLLENFDQRDYSHTQILLLAVCSLLSRGVLNKQSMLLDQLAAKSKTWNQILMALIFLLQIELHRSQEIFRLSVILIGKVIRTDFTRFAGQFVKQGGASSLISAMNKFAFKTHIYLSTLDLLTSLKSVISGQYINYLYLKFNQVLLHSSDIGFQMLAKAMQFHRLQKSLQTILNQSDFSQETVLKVSINAMNRINCIQLLKEGLITFVIKALGVNKVELVTLLLLRVMRIVVDIAHYSFRYNICLFCKPIIKELIARPKSSKDIRNTLLTLKTQMEFKFQVCKRVFHQEIKKQSQTSQEENLIKEGQQSSLKQMDLAIQKRQLTIQTILFYRSDQLDESSNTIILQAYNRLLYDKLFFVTFHKFCTFKDDQSLTLLQWIRISQSLVPFLHFQNHELIIIKHLLARIQTFVVSIKLDDLLLLLLCLTEPQSALLLIKIIQRFFAVETQLKPKRFQDLCIILLKRFILHQNIVDQLIVLASLAFGPISIDEYNKSIKAITYVNDNQVFHQLYFKLTLFVVCSQEQDELVPLLPQLFDIINDNLQKKQQEIVLILILLLTTKGPKIKNFILKFSGALPNIYQNILKPKFTQLGLEIICRLFHRKSQVLSLRKSQVPFDQGRVHLALLLLEEVQFCGRTVRIIDSLDLNYNQVLQHSIQKRSGQIRKFIQSKKQTSQLMCLLNYQKKFKQVGQITGQSEASQKGYWKITDLIRGTILVKNYQLFRQIQAIDYIQKQINIICVQASFHSPPFDLLIRLLQILDLMAVQRVFVKFLLNSGFVVLLMRLSDFLEELFSMLEERQPANKGRPQPQALCIQLFYKVLMELSISSREISTLMSKLFKQSMFLIQALRKGDIVLLVYFKRWIQTIQPAYPMSMKEEQFFNDQTDVPFHMHAHKFKELHRQIQNIIPLYYKIDFNSIYQEFILPSQYQTITRAFQFLIDVPDSAKMKQACRLLNQTISNHDTKLPQKLINHISTLIIQENVKQDKTNLQSLMVCLSKGIRGNRFPKQMYLVIQNHIPELKHCICFIVVSMIHRDFDYFFNILINRVHVDSQSVSLMLPLLLQLISCYDLQVLFNKGLAAYLLLLLQYMSELTEDRIEMLLKLVSLSCQLSDFAQYYNKQNMRQKMLEWDCSDQVKFQILIKLLPTMSEDQAIVQLIQNILQSQFMIEFFRLITYLVKFKRTVSLKNFKDKIIIYLKNEGTSFHFRKQLQKFVALNSAQLFQQSVDFFDLLLASKCSALSIVSLIAEQHSRNKLSMQKLSLAISNLIKYRQQPKAFLTLAATIQNYSISTMQQQSNLLSKQLVQLLLCYQYQISLLHVLQQLLINQKLIINLLKNKLPLLAVALNFVDYVKKQLIALQQFSLRESDLKLQRHLLQAGYLQYLMATCQNQFLLQKLCKLWRHNKFNLEQRYNIAKLILQKFQEPNDKMIPVLRKCIGQKRENRVVKEISMSMIKKLIKNKQGLIQEKSIVQMLAGYCQNLSQLFQAHLTEQDNQTLKIVLKIAVVYQFDDVNKIVSKLLKIKYVKPQSMRQTGIPPQSPTKVYVQVQKNIHPQSPNKAEVQAQKNIHPQSSNKVDVQVDVQAQKNINPLSPLKVDAQSQNDIFKDLGFKLFQTGKNISLKNCLLKLQGGIAIRLIRSNGTSKQGKLFLDQDKISICAASLPSGLVKPKYKLVLKHIVAIKDNYSQDKQFKLSLFSNLWFMQSKCRAECCLSIREQAERSMGKQINCETKSVQQKTQFSQNLRVYLQYLNQQFI